MARLALLVFCFGFCLVILRFFLRLLSGAEVTPSVLFERFSGAGTSSVVEGPGGPADDFGRS